METEKKREGLDTYPVDLDRLRSLINGNVEIERTLIALFFEQSEDNLKILEKNALTSGKNEEWRTTAHMLKGTAANLGASTLSKLCNEAQYFNGPGEARTQLYQKIQDECVRVQAYLREKGASHAH